MEGLTKQQLILLALLVSFVTSIATGIVTVSLMDQAPKTVTQTINRVVERTIEKVVPSSNGASVATPTITTKETVVVKADDMVVSAVEKNRGNIIRIIKIRDYSGEKKEKFGGLAIPVAKKGLLVADIAVLTKELDSFGSIIPESYKAITADGKFFSVVPVGVDEANSLVFFEARTDEGKPDASVSFSVVSFGDSNNLKLGQTVIAIGGENTDVISTGIVASLVADSNAKGTGDSIYGAIKTDVQFASTADGVSGTILLNLSGEVVGIMAGKLLGKGAYLPSNVISISAGKIGQTNGNTITP